MTRAVKVPLEQPVPTATRELRAWLAISDSLALLVHLAIVV